MSLSLSLPAFCICLAVLSPIGSARSQEATHDPARLLPESSLFYVELSQPEAILERILDPDVQRLYAMNDKVQLYKDSDDYAKLQAAVAKIEERLGEKWPEIVRGVAGSAHLGIDILRQSGVLIVKAKRPELLAKLHDALIEIIEADAKERGRESPVKSKEYEGVTGYSFAKSEAHAIVGDCLVVSNSPDSVKAVVDRAKNQSAKGLGGSDDFHQAKQLAGSGHAAWAFVRMAPLKLLPQFAKISEKNNSPIGELLAAGLLDAVRQASLAVMTLDIGPQGIETKLVAPRKAAKVAENRRWFFAPEAGQSAFAPLRPKGTILSITTYRDLAGLWDMKEKLFDDNTAAQLAKADTDLGQFFNGRDFQTEVLGAFSPRMQVVVTRQEFAADQPAPAVRLPAGAVVLQLKDPAEAGDPMLLAFQKFIGVINIVGGQNGTPQLLLNSEDYRGVTIAKATFLLNSSADRKARPVYLNASPSCARVGDRFVVGSTVGIVKSVIDELQQPTASQPTADNSLLELDVAALNAVLIDNRESLISQNMLQEGNAREQSEKEVQILYDLLAKVKSLTHKLVGDPDKLTVQFGLQMQAK